MALGLSNCPRCNDKCMLAALPAIQTVWLALILGGFQASGTLVVEVRSESGPVEQAEVVIRDEIAGVTGNQGNVTLQLPPGDIEITVQRYGFASKAIPVTVAAGAVQSLTVELDAESVLDEEIIVTTTRGEVRIEDEPLRVEVIEQEE